MIVVLGDLPSAHPIHHSLGAQVGLASSSSSYDGNNRTNTTPIGSLECKDLPVHLADLPSNNRNVIQRFSSRPASFG